MNYVDNPFESPVVISFCPGILGLERGLARAGVECRVAAYVEIEAFIIANLVTGMEAGVLDPAPIWTDAKTFDAWPFRGKVHGIIGGYPCPGESTAGLREGHLYKGFLWPSIRRAIQASRPLFCFFENVDDHLTGTYPIVQRSLRNMGYAVEAGIFTAEEAGAPHQRSRLFILAILGNAKGFYQPYDWFQSHKPKGKNRGSGIEMADPCPSGLQRNKLQQSFAEGIRQPEPLGSATECRITQWPAGQGPFQYDWEEPRTIEPGLGCTVDGYNFREDIIRAIGNSVVEQTAEIAFKNLMQKHLK
jgi:site-specific DNA-cytosine methylase